ncbi:MAG: hypothetical protein J6Q81_01450, partial [Lentisphaeria bacterium]|nr:hypothetical protein [Lentisphaeria bacterium]
AATLYISELEGVEFNPLQAEKLFILSAKGGYKPAMKALANLYMTGQKGFEKKPLEAEKWRQQYLKTKEQSDNAFIREPHL